MRIVQDSEDEDDFELELVGAAPNDGADASRDDPSPQQEHGHSTGSTASLKRTIEAAHRSHFQSFPDASSGDQHALHSSEHANKRRKTSSDAATVEAPVVSSSGKSRNSFNEPSLEERLVDAATVPTVPLTDRPWDLPGTVGEQWQHHEPLGMFAEASSTVPNGTATQRQLLREVMSPGFLGLGHESDVPPYEPAKSSIPWSDYLKSSSDAPDQPKPASQPELLSTLPPGNSNEDGPSPAVGAASQLSQRSRLGSTSQRKSSPLQYEVVQNAADLSGTMAPPALPTQAPPNGLDGNVTPRRKKASLASTPDPKEPRKSPRQHRKNQDDPLTASPPAKVQHKSSSVPNSDDDLLAMGLKKEEYKPRPFRSRSLKMATEDPIDYSARPEKAARKPRRSKTSSVFENGSAATTPEKIQQICDMGFTPSTTQKALKQNNGDMTSAVDWLVANGVTSEDELAPPKSSKSRNKGKANEEHATVPIDEASTRGDKSPRVSVVIPSKGHASPPKIDIPHQPSTDSPTKRDHIEAPRGKAKRRKTSMDQPEPPITEETPVPTTVSTAPPKEKKRGPPKKAAKSTESVVEGHEDGLENESKGMDSTLQEIQVNDAAPIATKADTEGTAKPSISLSTKQAITPVPSKTLDASPTTESTKETSETPQKPSSLAKTAQTAQSKGKPPYRVGLSKRARIAPLLRLVKK